MQQLKSTSSSRWGWFLTAKTKNRCSKTSFFFEEANKAKEPLGRYWAVGGERRGAFKQHSLRKKTTEGNQKKKS
jgi:hypothetical protein